MSIIYQSKFLEIIDKEELRNCIRNTSISNENIELILEHIKDIYNGTQTGEKIIEKFKKKKINIEKNEIILLIEEKFQKIREHLFPLFQNDNLNILMSNGCSIYSGSVGI